MKRSFESIGNGADVEGAPTNKVALIERGSAPGQVVLVNPLITSKKTSLEPMELEENVDDGETCTQDKAKKKLDLIDIKMKIPYVLMNDVSNETKLHHELNNAACNFVKKPGHVYHLYQRPSGQTYFGMLSPEEWTNLPHKFLGSFKYDGYEDPAARSVCGIYF